MPNSSNVTSPILIIGPGRSGTSWLIHILDKHPDVRTLIENTVLRGLYQEIFQSWWAKGWHWECDDIEQERRAIQAARVAMCELFPGDQAYWAMKMIWRGHPWHFAHKVFPNARYIHITRSPTTALLSMSEYLGQRNKAWCDLQYSENEYVEAHQDALKIRDAGFPYLKIRQEDAVVDPYSVWQEVRVFCELSDISVSHLDREINTSKSTAGKVQMQRTPLPWSRLKPETIKLSEELGYSPAAPDVSEPVLVTEVKKTAVESSEVEDEQTNHTDSYAELLETQILQLREELKMMKATRGWRVLETYWTWRDWLKLKLSRISGNRSSSKRPSLD